MSSQAIIEFEFHISPAPSSSRPQTSVGTRGARSSTRLRDRRIIRQPSRTFDCFAGVRDDSATPAAHLVAEDQETSRPAGTNRTLGDDATLGSVAIADRCLLDHETPRRHVYLERSVIEVARLPPLEPRRYCLEDASVQPHRVAARSEREPVDVDSRFGLSTQGEDAERSAHGC